jgi:hypothetical protein
VFGSTFLPERVDLALSRGRGSIIDTDPDDGIRGSVTEVVVLTAGAVSFGTGSPSL